MDETVLDANIDKEDTATQQLFKDMIAQLDYKIDHAETTIY